MVINIEFEIMNRIAVTVNKIYLWLTGQISSPTTRGTTNGWNYLKVGKSWFYERVVTYAGAANTQDIDFLKSVQINRIEQIWDDTTTKDFSIRVFSDTMISYVELDTQTGNTATSRLLQLGTEYKYPAGSRLRFYSGTNTNAKTNTIRVQADEL